MNTKQILGLIGSFTLIVGVFMPVVSLPVYGTMNLFSFERGDGKIVLALGIISLFLILIKKYNGLWFTGLASFGMSIATLIYIQNRVSSVREQLRISGNPFAGLGELALSSVQVQWGLAIIFIGAVLVIISAASKKMKEHVER